MSEGCIIRAVADGRGAVLPAGTAVTEGAGAREHATHEHAIPGQRSAEPDAYGPGGYAQRASDPGSSGSWSSGSRDTDRGSYDRDLMLPAYIELASRVQHLLLETIGWSQHFQAGFHENWDRLRRIRDVHATFVNQQVVPWMRERGFPQEAIEAVSKVNGLGQP